MRILMLTQWFQPEPVFKGLPLAKAFRDLGHEVEVLTGFPNYPGGKLYPGYRVRPWQAEVMEGIPVKRVALYPSHDESGLRRILNYTSFGLSAGVLGPLLVKRPDVVYVYNMVTTAAAARWLRALTGCRILLDVQDLWPDAVAHSKMMGSPRLLAALGRWCMAEYRRADGIVTLSPGVKEKLCQGGVPPERVEVIYNWCDETEITVAAPDPALARQWGFEGRFNVVFAGTMGKGQALDAVLEAARSLAESCPEVLFTFIGGGIEVERLQGLAAGASNVQFIPRQPASQIGAFLALADVVLVHVKAAPFYEMVIPSKVQAYMYSGKPILIAVPGDATRLVEAAGAGLGCLPENPASLAAGVEALRDLPREQLAAMGASGQTYYHEHLSMKVGVAALDRALRRVAGQPGEQEVANEHAG
jgi:colanic acid biosynthesis glycosyl transferase WcaI